MAEKFNPYRAGQPLSGNGNPNTGVWQRTWEDGGPGRASFGGPQTAGGVADWRGDSWKPEAPGLSQGLSKSINNSVDKAIQTAAYYGLGKKGDGPEPPNIPKPNQLAIGPATPAATPAARPTLAIGPATPELEAAQTPLALNPAKTPLALNPAPKRGSNGTATFQKKAGNAHLNIIPQRGGSRTTTIKKAGANSINSIASRNKDAIDVPWIGDDNDAPQGQLPAGNVGEGLTDVQMAYQQTVNRGREQAQRSDQLPTNDVPSHESIQQGVQDSREWHKEASQDAPSTSSPQSGTRSRAGANPINPAALHKIRQELSPFATKRDRK